MPGAGQDHAPASVVPASLSSPSTGRSRTPHRSDLDRRLLCGGRGSRWTLLRGPRHAESPALVAVISAWLTGRATGVTVNVSWFVRLVGTSPSVVPTSGRYERPSRPRSHCSVSLEAGRRDCCRALGSLLTVRGLATIALRDRAAVREPGQPASTVHDVHADIDTALATRAPLHGCPSPQTPSFSPEGRHGPPFADGRTSSASRPNFERSLTGEGRGGLHFRRHDPRRHPPRLPKRHLPAPMRLSPRPGRQRLRQGRNRWSYRPSYQ